MRQTLMKWQTNQDFEGEEKQQTKCGNLPLKKIVCQTSNTSVRVEQSKIHDFLQQKIADKVQKLGKKTEGRGIK